MIPNLRQRPFIAFICAAMAAGALALDGQPGMHDPSTVVVHEGRYYSYGTPSRTMAGPGAAMAR
jgi:hypothetical protein